MIQNQLGCTMWRDMKHCARIWCQKLSKLLFECTCAYGNMWGVAMLGFRMQFVMKKRTGLKLYQRPYLDQWLEQDPSGKSHFSAETWHFRQPGGNSWSISSCKIALFFFSKQQVMMGIISSGLFFLWGFLFLLKFQSSHHVAWRPRFHLQVSCIAVILDNPFPFYLCPSKWQTLAI